MVTKRNNFEDCLTCEIGISIINEDYLFPTIQDVDPEDAIGPVMDCLAEISIKEMEEQYEEELSEPSLLNPAGDETWIDPAGGIHDAHEADPAKMYE